jgi:hypothetical protein
MAGCSSAYQLTAATAMLPMTVGTRTVRKPPVKNALPCQTNTRSSTTRWYRKMP